MQQRCWDSEAKAPKSQHNRTWFHPVCQLFFSAGLGLLSFDSFSGVNPTHRAHSIFYYT